jgi:hypothetical protein
MSEKEWHKFDYKDYCKTGPRRDDGFRYDGPVEVLCDDGSVKVTNFYTRLIGGFTREVGKVTHWRFTNEPAPAPPAKPRT